MSPHLTLMVITDGRWDCLARTLDSFARRVDDHNVVFDTWMLVNDSVGDDYNAGPDGFDIYVEASSYHKVDGVQKMGFAGAIQRGWANLPSETDFVFHLEDDFIFNRDLNVAAMVEVLTDHPYLVQMALRRQPVAPAEIAAGGVVELHPEAFVDETDGANHWLEHSLFFTTNPCLYRRALTNQGWPTGPGSEMKFTHRILRNPAARFGYWGRRDDKPWVEHIGAQRMGTGY